MQQAGSCQWIDDHEWKCVCSWLYGTKIEDKRKGISRVAAWRARGVVPFQVESTVGVVECLIKEETDSDHTQETLCLMFAMAITRFINGIYDYGVLRGGHGTIYQVVKEFGVPFWLVDLRHEGTHRTLPFLSSLKQGAEFCYEWLLTNYWQCNEGGTQDESCTGSDLTRPLPVSNDERGVVSINSGSFEPRLSESGIWGALDCFHDDQSSFNRHEVYKPLANATTSDFTILLRKKVFLCPLEGVDSKLSKVPSKTKLSDLPCLSLSLYSLWKSLLHQMGRRRPKAKTNLISALIIVSHCPSSDHEWAWLLAAWLGALLSVSTPCADKPRSLQTGQTNLTDVLMEGKVEWERLMETLKVNPGYFSYALVNICLKNMSLDSGTAKDILHVTALVTISQRSGYHSLPLSLPSLSPSETPLQIEFEELLFKLRGRKTEAIETIRDDDGGVVQDGHPHCCKWERASSAVDWYNVPLGLVPHEDGLMMLTPVSLDLPEDVAI